jgi:hypothetical protein
MARVASCSVSLLGWVRHSQSRTLCTHPQLAQEYLKFVMKQIGLGENITIYPPSTATQASVEFSGELSNIPQGRHSIVITPPNQDITKVT